MREKTDFKSVDDYILYQAPSVRAGLVLLRHTIHAAAPEALEVISYQMPALKLHGIVVYYAVHTNHYGLYVSPPVLLHFKEALVEYVTTKSAIHFPLGKPIPLDLVTDLVRYAVSFNLEKQRLKKH